MQEDYIREYEFVQELGKLLNMAKPNLVKCEFKLGEELPPEERWIQTEEMFDGKMCKCWHSIMHQPQGQYVIVTCRNGYQYKINVTDNSLAAIAEAVFDAMVCK